MPNEARWMKKKTRQSEGSFLAHLESRKSNEIHKKMLYFMHAVFHSAPWHPPRKKKSASSNWSRFLRRNVITFAARNICRLISWGIGFQNVWMIAFFQVRIINIAPFLSQLHTLTQEFCLFLLTPKNARKYQFFWIETSKAQPEVINCSFNIDLSQV